MITGRYRRWREARPRLAWAVAVVCLASSVWPQDRWQAVRAEANAGRLDSALALVEQRLTQTPDDLEARGWHARILAWRGRWSDAELEYRYVLARVPSDTDILCGLADVLVWQGKTPEALDAADRARRLAPASAEVLLCRARVLRAMGRGQDARTQYREILALDPHNHEASLALSSGAEEYKHQLHIGADIDSFNYTDSAQAESVQLDSRWTSRWSTVFGANFYQRFGQDAGKFLGGSTLRFAGSNWLSLGGAAARANGVIPQRELFAEYGHGFGLNTLAFKGLEISYQQHWFWYEGAHVLTVSFTQLYYLAHDWTWSLTLTGARSGFSGAGVDWLPSGSTRLTFPVYRRLSANLGYANGAENFASVDQIGHFAARTFAGGLKYRFSERHDLNGYVAVQDRSQSRTQNSFGLSYGYRF